MKTNTGRNNEYLLSVNNILQNENLIWFPLLLLDLPLVFGSPSLLRQWPVTSCALKPDVSLPAWKDIRHDSLQEIYSYRTSKEITIFREAF